MLSAYSKTEALTILAIGLLLGVCAVLLGLWWLLAAVVVATATLVGFFRDPDRRTPTQRGVVVAPADGRVSSIHRLERFEAFGAPATCIRIFLSIFDVHVNRSPCHGCVTMVSHKDGDHRSALNPDSAEANESNLIVLAHPLRRCPVAAVRQVAGLFARTIVCGVRAGDIVQRGQRIGMIKLGSTTELYLPEHLTRQVVVKPGQKVKGGITVLALVGGLDAGHDDRQARHDHAAAPETPAGLTATAANASPAP